MIRFKKPLAITLAITTLTLASGFSGNTEGTTDTSQSASSSVLAWDGTTSYKVSLYYSTEELAEGEKPTSLSNCVLAGTVYSHPSAFNESFNISTKAPAVDRLNGSASSVSGNISSNIIQMTGTASTYNFTSYYSFGSNAASYKSAVGNNRLASILGGADAASANWNATKNDFTFVTAAMDSIVASMYGVPGMLANEVRLALPYGQDIVDSLAELDDAAYLARITELLLPTSAECVVPWVVVVEPMYGITNGGYTPALMPDTFNNCYLTPNEMYYIWGNTVAALATLDATYPDLANAVATDWAKGWTNLSSAATSPYKMGVWNVVNYVMYETFMPAIVELENSFQAQPYTTAGVQQITRTSAIDPASTISYINEVVGSTAGVGVIVTTAAGLEVPEEEPEEEVSSPTPLSGSQLVIHSNKLTEQLTYGEATGTASGGTTFTPTYNTSNRGSYKSPNGKSTGGTSPYTYTLYKYTSWTYKYQNTVESNSWTILDSLLKIPEGWQPALDNVRDIKGNFTNVIGGLQGSWGVTNDDPTQGTLHSDESSITFLAHRAIIESTKQLVIADYMNDTAGNTSYNSFITSGAGTYPHIKAITFPESLKGEININKTTGTFTWAKTFSGDTHSGNNLLGNFLLTSTGSGSQGVSVTDTKPSASKVNYEILTGLKLNDLKYTTSVDVEKTYRGTADLADPPVDVAAGTTEELGIGTEHVIQVYGPKEYKFYPTYVMEADNSTTADTHYDVFLLGENQRTFKGQEKLKLTITTNPSKIIAPYSQDKEDVDAGGNIMKSGSAYQYQFGGGTIVLEMEAIIPMSGYADGFDTASAEAAFTQAFNDQITAIESSSIKMYSNLPNATPDYQSLAAPHSSFSDKNATGNELLEITDYKPSAAQAISRYHLYGATQLNELQDSTAASRPNYASTSLGNTLTGVFNNTILTQSMELVSRNVDCTWYTEDFEGFGIIRGVANITIAPKSSEFAIVHPDLSDYYTSTNALSTPYVYHGKTLISGDFGVGAMLDLGDITYATSTLADGHIYFQPTTFNVRGNVTDTVN